MIGIAIPVLIGALSDEDKEVRSRAASALALIGESAKNAVPALIEALGDEAGQVRSGAARALKTIGTPEAMKAVEEYEKNR